MTYEELTAQLGWAPAIESERPGDYPRIVVGGMGGSALPAHAARFLDPKLPVHSHRDYDLPAGASADALYVAISYSGNTAETLSFAHAAHEKGFPLAAIASGGELASFAKDNAVPFVRVPAGLPPRDALFYLLHALYAFIGEEELRSALGAVAFDPGAAHAEADDLAGALRDTLPSFYASRRNGFLAEMAKISFNETAKMPASANVFPELNHNEMQSFDTSAPENVTALARFVLLRDATDDSRIARRMDVFTEVMRTRGRVVRDLPVGGASRAETLVRGWYVAYLAALALANVRGIDPDAVPLVEDFKKRL
ncbi:MAG TPA: SIS domain-containing protein [Candidatus Paceibacterota bacterium]|nr:SIS domain-containing protein [Candidatus Paceibacterota bacterium]